MTTLNLQVSASGDDGHAGQTGVSFNATQLWMIAGNVSTVPFGVWARFTGVSGLTSVTIDTATLTLRGEFNANSPGVLQKIYADDQTAPAAPTDAAEFQAITLTTAAIDWDEDSVLETETAAPDLSAIIQELADSYDPSVIQIIIRDDGSASDDYNFWTTYDSSTPDAARLDIDYTYTQAAAGSLTPAGALVTKVLAALAGSLTPTGALTAIKTLLQAAAGSLAPAGALVTKVLAALAGSGSLTPTGSLETALVQSLGGAQKTLGGIPSVALTIGSETALGQHVIAYHYEELSEQPGYLTIWLDNRSDRFDDLDTDFPTLVRGAEVTLSRGLVISGVASREDLPTCWVETLEYTEDGELQVTCIDWLGLLEVFRYATDTEFLASTHAVIASSVLGEVGLTLATGSFGYAVDFLANKFDDGDEITADLMSQCHEVLYTGLAKEIQFKQLDPAAAATYAYDFANGTADHPLMEDSMVQESSARFNKVTVIGGDDEQFTGSATNSTEITLTGQTRLLTERIPTLDSDAECIEAAENILRNEQAQAIAAVLVARPHFTLRLYDVVSVTAPPWGGPSIDAARVIEIIEDYDTRSPQQKIWEQEIVLGDMLAQAIEAEEDSGRSTRRRRRSGRRRRARRSRRSSRRSRRRSRRRRGSGSGGGSTEPGDIPIGGIIMWRGGSIPAGWALCDGTAPTPDLRDRFVIGSGSTYAIDATGGLATVDIRHSHTADGTLAAASDSHSHGDGTLAAASDSHSHTDGTLATASDSHGHTITGSVASDSHSHSNGTLAAASIAPPSTVNVESGVAEAAFADVSHGHSITGSTASDAHGHGVGTLSMGNDNHSHDVTGSTASDAHGHDVTGSTASDAHGHDVTGSTANSLSATQDILPPFYALAFIMRIY